MTVLSLKSKNGKTINTISTSDWHLGNNRITPQFMIEGLKSTITPQLLDKTDILFIEGDIWDKGLSLPALQVPEIFLYFYYLLTLCHKHNVKVRVLEGTPLHDRKQSKFIKVINTMIATPCDLKYYDKLCIDYEEDLGIHILYVPDEWKGSTTEAWEDVQKELHRHDITQVDYAIMHGCFKYQMPEGFGIDCHLEENYLPIVKRYIYIGHIHHYSRYEHIIANGSHDRTTFAEEELKGIVFTESYGNDRSQDKVTFIENKKAMQFINIHLKGVNSNDVPVVIDTVVQDLISKNILKDVFIRVLSPDSVINRTFYSSFSKEYKMYNWYYETVTEKQKKTKERKQVQRLNVVINRSSIEQQVKDKLIAQDAKDIDYCIEELLSLVKE